MTTVNETSHHTNVTSLSEMWKIYFFANLDLLFCCDGWVRGLLAEGAGMSCAVPFTCVPPFHQWKGHKCLPLLVGTVAAADIVLKTPFGSLVWYRLITLAWTYATPKTPESFCRQPNQTCGNHQKHAQVSQFYTLSQKKTRHPTRVDNFTKY